MAVLPLQRPLQLLLAVVLPLLLLLLLLLAVVLPLQLLLLRLPPLRPHPRVGLA